MIVEEILNELKICHYSYDKINGTIKVSESVNIESDELGRITTELKNNHIVYSVDRNQNIQIEE